MEERTQTERIYLDQNIWIGLSQASEDHAHRLVPLLEASRWAVAEDRAVFVLSMAHYEENWRRPQLRDRLRVGRIMAELSRFNTIASPE
ncbi:MAG: hypothetical protein AB7Q27_29385, partial [Acidimicrobiia bacterium]